VSVSEGGGGNSVVRGLDKRVSNDSGGGGVDSGVVETIDTSTIDTGVGRVTVGRVQESGIGFSLTLDDVLNGTVLGNIAGAENSVGDSGVLLRVVVVGDGVAGDGSDVVGDGVAGDGSDNRGDGSVVDNGGVDGGNGVCNGGGLNLNVSGLLNDRLDNSRFHANNGDAGIGVMGQGKTSGVGEGGVKPSGGVDKSRVGFRLGSGGSYQGENYELKNNLILIFEIIIS